MATIKVLAGDLPKGNCNYQWGQLQFGFLKQKVISDTELETVEIATEESVKKIGGTVGWGVAGAVILGPVGLLAGLLLGGKNKEVTFVAKFKSGKKIFASTDSKTFTKLQSVSFKKTSTETEPISISRKPELDNSNKLEKLIKLNDMFDKGFITEDEFKQYKESLDYKVNKLVIAIGNEYQRNDGRVYILTQDGLARKGKDFITYDYDYSIKLLKSEVEFSEV